MKSKELHLESNKQELSDLNSYKLGDICNITTGRLNSNAAESFGKYPFFTCSKEEFRINSYSFDCEAILLAGNNAIGDFGIKHYNGKFNAYQRTYILTIKDSKKFDYDFIFYTLKTKLKLFQSYSFGTATQYLTKSILEPFEIDAPDISQQRKIGKILATLDKLIENLRVSNTVLEKIIQSIFQSWFIDFDGQIEFVDSELGKIPKGWSLNNLKNACDIIYRYPAFYGMEKFKHGIPVIRGEHITDEGYLSLDFSDYWFVSPEFSDKFPKTILDLYDVVISVRGSVGKIGIVGNAHVESQISPNCIRIKANNEKILPLNLYYNIKQDSFRNLLTSSVSTSAVPGIQAEAIKSAEIIIPPMNIQEKFEIIALSLFKKIDSSRTIIKKLEKIRDSLLPKLMSGEIRV